MMQVHKVTKKRSAEISFFSKVFILINSTLLLSSCTDITNNVDKNEAKEVLSTNLFLELPDDVLEVEQLESFDENILDYINKGMGETSIKEITELTRDNVNKADKMWEILSASSDKLGNDRCYICKNKEACDNLVKKLEEKNFSLNTGEGVLRAGNSAANCEITKVKAENEALKKQEKELESEIKNLEEKLEKLKNELNKQNSDIKKAQENMFKLQLSEYESQLDGNLAVQKINLEKKVLASWKEGKITPAFAWKFVLYSTARQSNTKNSSNTTGINDEIMMVSVNIDNYNSENIDRKTVDIIATSESNTNPIASIADTSIVIVDENQEIHVKSLKIADEMKLIS